ncbi:MAG: UDP-glucose 4-epimerase GalE [Oscillospiraceae bacterium]
MAVLVTGGTGYIGSHTCVELLAQNEDVIILDNLSNSKVEVLEKIEKISGKRPKFYKADLLDAIQVDKIFAENEIDTVIHFAGLKAVGESVQKPLMYYHNNITGTLILCETMLKHNVKNIVFSSSATVYGCPQYVPIDENHPLSTTNPYGSTKLMLEQILTDINKSNGNFNVALLRYFNPIGAHSSGLIGEDPNGIPNNLVPYIAQVAVGKLPAVNVFGDDYDTPDGTGVRDYIHVVDLAVGHIKALNKVRKDDGVFIYNLGTGNGYSVLDIIHAYEKAAKKTIPYKITPRRAGDIAQCYANPQKAFDELGFKAEFGIDKMCEDSWNFTQNN